MSDASTPSPPKSSRLMIILATVAVLAVVAVLVAVFYVSPQLEERRSAAAAEAFRDLLKAGKLEEAYQSSGDNFKRWKDVGYLKELMKSHPTLQEMKITSSGVTRQAIAGGQYHQYMHWYRMDGAEENQIIELNIQTKEEDGAWKVYGVGVDIVVGR
jgi:hypothetical protein